MTPGDAGEGGGGGGVGGRRSMLNWKSRVYNHNRIHSCPDKKLIPCQCKENVYKKTEKNLFPTNLLQTLLKRLLVTLWKLDVVFLAFFREYIRLNLKRIILES